MSFDLDDLRSEIADEFDSFGCFYESASGACRVVDVEELPPERKVGRPPTMVWFSGQWVALRDKARELGTDVRTLFNRLKRGKPIDQALTEAVQRRCRRATKRREPEQLTFRF